MRCLMILIVCLVSACAFGAGYGGGSGSEGEPYQIWTAEQMNTIGLHPEDWDKHFILMKDIDMSGYNGIEYNTIGLMSHNIQHISPGSLMAIAGRSSTSAISVKPKMVAELWMGWVCLVQ